MLRMKLFVTLALLALCVTVAGTAAFAQSWAVAASDLPSALTWDESYAGSVDVENDGVTDLTVAGFELWSVEGTTLGITLIDRWGIDSAALPADIAPAATDTVDLALVAPPITGTFECDWVLEDLSGPAAVLTDLAEADVTINRYPDILPGRDGEWAAAAVESCAGRVPFIVQGFDDGIYRPRLDVARDAMAVFIRRAMAIPQLAWADTFSDVPDGYWAGEDIEALADAGVVQGYGDGSYQPALVVNRAQMAVYIARAAGLPDDDPASDPFPDVPIGYWADSEIQACVDASIVLGFDDGLYRPTTTVTRDQLAVYCYRAFIQATAVPVVLGGPGLTDVDPGAAAFDGFSSVDTDAGFAYVVFDVANLDAALAGADTWDIEFDFRDAATPTVAGTTATVNVSAAQLTAAAGTYFTVYTAVPGLAAGDYVLVVSVEDAAANVVELSRKPTLTIS